jgi:hypothetical protein
VLEVSVLDAFIAGLSAAFFGALVAGGAYLLKEQLRLREQVASMQQHLDDLRRISDVLDSYGTLQVAKESFMPRTHRSGDDADA